MGTEKTMVEMTAEERAKYEAFLAAERAEREKAELEEERQRYKELVSDVVESFFPRIEKLSEELSKEKRAIYDSFATALDLKGSIYGVREGQNSHTFINGDKNKRITLGYHTVDGWDDTVNDGIAKVHGYIESLAKDDDTRALVNAILRLLRKDGKSGQLKAGKVMQLRTMANESGNADFLDGVNIIEKSYQPTKTKQYVRAEYKNGINEWVSVPLGMTEA